MKNLPYVISAELELANEEWIKQDELEAFREDLDRELRDMGKDTQWVGAGRLQSGIGSLALGTTVPIVSLDRRYIQMADSYLDVSRAVNEDLSEAGYDARLGAKPILEQFDELGRRYAGREVVLVDDVLFSGEMIATVQALLALRDIRVSALLCGIAIGDGEEKVRTLGIDVANVMSFPDVEDELCERDFTALSGSGRKVLGQQMGALYFDDQFGRPEQWASIPAEYKSQFCVNSLLRNRQLLHAATPFPAFVGYPEGETGAVLDSVINERAERSLK